MPPTEVFVAALGVIILTLGVRLDDEISKVLGTVLAAVALGLLLADHVTTGSLAI